MLKNQAPSHNVNQSSLDAEKLYTKLFELIEFHIPNFNDYLKDSDEKLEGENQITGELESFFREKISEGELPYRFQNQYPYATSTRTSDIGIKINRKIFCVIEAKLLSENAHSTEYVCGRRGGIERFKRNVHATGLPYAVMVGYIQKQDAAYWHNRVNGKIEQLSKSNTDISINWNKSEKLNSKVSNFFLNKYESASLRISTKSIKLYHYWIDLSN